MDSIPMQKRELRAQLRKDRELAFAPDSWLHILQAREFLSAKIVASYLSYGFEPQTKDLNETLLNTGKRVLLPRTLKSNEIEWVEWRGEENSLKRNGKVMEPTGEVYTDLHLIDIVIVPALRIDRAGNRIGQGGGSYDRALSRISGWKVGLVGALEISGEPLPVEEHDQRVDAAATPTVLVRIKPVPRITQGTQGA